MVNQLSLLYNSLHKCDIFKLLVRVTCLTENILSSNTEEVEQIWLRAAFMLYNKIRGKGGAKCQGGWMWKFKEGKHNSYLVVWVNNGDDGLRGHWLDGSPAMCHTWTSRTPYTCTRRKGNNRFMTAAMRHNICQLLAFCLRKPILPHKKKTTTKKTRFDMTKCWNYAIQGHNYEINIWT